ncbi:penicillin acylase family protein [uncultured Aquimarina sp.]|uniref:penicillin acylase family protein n=1 Tax=uncultured Aquimarina sp. TaxID=575652 RepID=UPI00262879B0|nr:penicillin acylase family protein [uncultured Aquimarina sp.]
MKIIKTVFILILCVGWIFVTNHKYEPINSIGSLLTYKTGLLSIPLQESGIEEIESEYKPKIYIDDIGIPHIYGDKKNDVAFGLGYMHAKDRYFQMEMITRTVLGEMSEVFSEKTVSSDSFWKPYEFERKATELLEDYKKNTPEFYEYLLAYSEGVNEYLLQDENTDPIYKIFGETPRVWKPKYSLLVTWYMSWSLTYFDQHVGLNEILTSLSDKERDYFYPLQPKGLKTILPSNDSVKVYKEKKFIEAIVSKNEKEKSQNPLGFHAGIGSNNWVVNAIKTENGKSILANDPHLFLTLPEAFYEAHMISDSLKVYGFSIPGVPVIVSGHNNQVSWGITNGEWDLIDRYQLKVKSDSLYLYKDNWIPFDQKQYRIKIKGKKDRIIHQNTTVHGKVIKENNDAYYAQHWYAENKSYSIKSMYEMMQSQNWNDFTSSLKDYGYPPQNFIYTDRQDNIGIVCAGKLPDRDQNYMGELLDGTQKNQLRKSMDTLWYTQNPSNKFLFSGNQQPIQNNTYFGYHGLKDDYRVERINSLLKEKNDWGIGEIKKMQSDEIDLSFFEFKELFAIYNVPDEYKELINGLKEWNGDMKADNNQALVYELLRRGIEKEAENFAKTYLKVNHPPSFKYFTKYLKDDEYTIMNSKPKQEVFSAVLRSVDSILNHYHGEEWKEETYKNISSLKIKNISFLPGLSSKIDDVGGNTNTINMNTRYHHPVFRAVYEMGKDSVKSYTVLAGGQSGKINSKHYIDQLELWRKGKYKQSQFENNPNRLKNIKNIIKFN